MEGDRPTLRVVRKPLLKVFSSLCAVLRSHRDVRDACFHHDCVSFTNPVPHKQGRRVFPFIRVITRKFFSRHACLHAI